MSFGKRTLFHCWVCDCVLNLTLQRVVTGRMYKWISNLWSVFDCTGRMISLKSARSWNCRSQGQKNQVYGGCLALDSFSSLIPLGRFAPSYDTCSAFTFWQLVKVGKQKMKCSSVYLCYLVLNSFAEWLIDWLTQLATWQGWWIWRYWIKKKSYTWEDAAFLTCSYLAIPNSVWNSMSMGSLTLFGSSKQKIVQLLGKKICRNQIMRVGSSTMLFFIHVFIHSTICTITGHWFLWLCFLLIYRWWKERRNGGKTTLDRI
jgi:hypothetical protein